MIPRKIEVEGFLCYRERQVIDLDGSDLWVFSGGNGSGKSTIFDAIRFALYGVLRDGGKQGLEDLINHDSPEFRVAFEFDLGPDRFRIKRELRRGGRSGRFLDRREVDPSGEEHWYPVAETDGRDGLNRWVAQNIGLSDEMFTCSTLLRQGHAERLLEAHPKDRFGIVAEVADLKSYQLLHERAAARRLERKNRLDGIRADLARRPSVEPAEFDAAEARLDEAARARARASAERDRLAALAGRADRWRELAVDRQEALGQAERARLVIAESAAIGADWDRLQGLDRWLPVWRAERDRRAEVVEGEAMASELAASRAGLDLKLGKLADLAEQSRGRLVEVEQGIARDEARRSAILDRRAELTGPIHRARTAADRRRAVASLEASLAGYPDDLAGRVDRLAAEAARCTGWGEAWATLKALAEAREGLAGARSRIGAGSVAVARAEEDARRSRGALEAARASAALAIRAREEADRREVEAQTVLRSAEGRLALFEGLEGATSCDRCGQPLTPEHYRAEARRLVEALVGARRVAEESGRSLIDARSDAEAAEVARADADRAALGAEAASLDARRSLDQAEADAARFDSACARSFGDLDEPFRSRVAPAPAPDWSVATFPTPGDLAEGRRLRDAAGEARRLAREARSRLDARDGERSRLEEARRALDEVGLLPGDEGAEAEQSRLAEESAAIDRRLKAHRLEEASAEAAVGELASKREELRAKAAVIDSRRMADLARIEALREESARARGSIPEGWRAPFDGATPDEIESREAERLDLRARGVERLAGELPQADWSLKSAEARLAHLEARLAEIPEEARRDPAEVAEARRRAVDRLSEAEEAARARQRDVDSLRRDRDERAGLEALALEADRAFTVSAKLAELLGRGSLQRALIRDAERGILDHSNPILRDISGGDLEIRLSAGESADDQALALEVIDRTRGSDRPIGAAFLSGSQRFRVAVSLALGIGQYARGLDRPIQSVIIDEGFGSLDRQGRDGMIAHLNRLKGRLARVVLVSHQEEFAESFKDGYHFEAREDGSTVVREVHR